MIKEYGRELLVVILFILCLSMGFKLEYDKSILKSENKYLETALSLYWEEYLVERKEALEDACFIYVIGKTTSKELQSKIDSCEEDTIEVRFDSSPTTVLISDPIVVRKPTYFIGNTVEKHVYEIKE